MKALFSVWLVGETRREPTVDFHADESAWFEALRFPLPATLRVLLAEDNPVNQLLACALLSRWGIEPKIACNGAEAVRFATEAAFDIILMDIEMPVMDGLAATVNIRRHERKQPGRHRVPVIAYTACDVDSYLGVLKQSGIDDILKKPCDAGELGQCLHSWCALESGSMPAPRMSLARRGDEAAVIQPLAV